MVQAQSIDTFIDNHAGNPHIAICGKLAIVKTEREQGADKKLLAAELAKVNRELGNAVDALVSLGKFGCRAGARTRSRGAQGDFRGADARDRQAGADRAERRADGRCPDRAT